MTTVLLTFEDTESIQHFHDKLLGMTFKTAKARQIALKMHDHMRSFVEQFEAEWSFYEAD